MSEKRKKDLLVIIYFIVALYAFHNFLSYFTFSNFLDLHFSKVSLSIIFASGALLAIVFSNLLGNLVRKFTNYKLLSFILIGQFLATTALALSNSLNIYLIAIFAVLYLVQNTLLWVSINIFIEELSDNENTGSIRGAILTIYNFQSIIAPFLAAHFLGLISYTGVFVISAVTLLPLFYLNKKFFKEIKEPEYKYVNLIQSFAGIRKDKNMRGVIASSFALNSFFAVVNIYLILYLVEVINIPTSVFVGIITPISLLPFIIVPYQLGKYSDQIFGSKKLMISGIFLASIVLIAIYVFNINSSNILLWIILLFVSRFGATFAETENYAYFYRKVDSDNTGLIALFQNMFNVGFLAVSILGAILLKFFNAELPLIFFIIGLIGLVSIFIIIEIEDRKPELKKVEIKKKKEETKIENKEELVEKKEENVIEIPNKKGKKDVKIWA